MISGQRLEVGHLLLRFTLVSAARKECLQVSRLIVQIAHGFPCRATAQASAQQQPLTRFPPLYKLYLPSSFSPSHSLPANVDLSRRVVRWREKFSQNFPRSSRFAPLVVALMSHYSALPR